MPLLTTTIGAFPKPAYVALPDWFNQPGGPDAEEPTRGWAAAVEALGDEATTIIERGVREVIALQIEAGVDILTDGEVARENYVHYHCRHLDGIDFDALTTRSLRNGAYTARLPTIRAKVTARAPFLVRDWERAQAASTRPVKATLPGPMTIGDTTADAYYDDPRARGADLAEALNVDVRALAEAGCRHIQIDEPLFARKVDDALAFGFDHLEHTFNGCPPEVTRTVHMCCGYPDRLDNPNYPKAERRCYFELAPAIEASSIDAVSIEDAHRPNDLDLLERFATKTVVLGVVAIAKSAVEPEAQIADRLRRALHYIDAERLVAAPDCGLGLLGRDLAMAKLRNLCGAAKSV